MSDSTSMQTESTAAAPAVETSTPSAAESSVKLESSASNGATPSTLEDKIIQQVEFYMSEYNLPRDPHLKQLYDSNDSAVPIATIATFNRMKQLTEDLAIVIAALKKSTKLVVSSDGKMISRSEPLPEKLKTTRNSIYVEGLPLKATLDELQQFFGNIKGADLKCVRMLRDPAFKLEQKGKTEKTEGEQPASKKLKTEDKEESKSETNETENANAAAQSDADAANTNVKTEDSSSTAASASDSSSSSSSSSSSVEKDKRLDRKLLFNGNAFVEFGSSDEVTAVVAQALIYPGQSEPLKLMTKVAFFNIQQKEKREKEEEQKLAKKGKFARKTKSDVDNENDAKEGKNGDEMEEDKLGNNKKRKHDGDGNDDKAAKLSKGDGEDGDGEAEEESIPALTMVADRLLKLSNLSESTSRESLREFFSSHSIDIAYVDFARGQTSAVIRLLSEKESGAKEVAQYLQEKKENIDGAEVSVSVLEGEEEKNYWEEMKKKQAERRERSSSKRGRGSRRGRGRGGRGRGGRGRGRGRGKRQRSD